MKISVSKLLVGIVLTTGGCTQNTKPSTEAITKPTEVTVAATYEFKYDKLTISFSGKSNSTHLAGKIELSESGLEVSKGNQIEKYSLKHFTTYPTSLLLETENNRLEKATWSISEADKKTHIQVEMDGVIAEFNITSGQFSEIPFFGVNDRKVVNNNADKDKLYEWNKEYVSSQYGYSIRVPETFKKEEANRPHIDLKFVDNFGSSILVNVTKRLQEEYQITAHDYTTEFLEQAFKQATPNAHITFNEKITVSGENAFLIENEGTDPKLKAMSCYLYHEDHAFMITATCEKSRFDNYRQLFRKCIESLKF